MDTLFEEDDYYTGPQLVPSMVQRAEHLLGVRLPPAYIDLLYRRNGGVPRDRCCPTAFETTWAPDHIQISAIRGIGGEWGIEESSGIGSADMIAEWGYPDVGVVICDMPSAGHDAVMLDYSESGPQGEPAVVYVDEERIPRRIAGSFGEFLELLVACDSFADSGGE
ncbi:SMI1/KNR4 family protein [Solwaraspora sp. WMMD406]|uniref:SMI1/KNR4 family protein n=1 Tax=Solwaraspora sp. WMMD406 TaxID=3016095 RepID=UPI002416992D|nr:SMI1/KNR4 family protein [Solwaraspora sp. WMMD406]MDG4762728.1 SMI1/KNR4 family protein [Solwaraspora sp. WMMD406]